MRIEELSKSYGGFHALRRVSLEVFEGELVCFLGPSGCGKTTLLRAIAGLAPQDAGRIEQAGRDISRLPPSRRDYGIVFQSYALFPNLTVAANVGYGLASRHLPRAGIEARVKELLELVGLATSGAKYPNQLSGGQQQRVALARALATSPGLLLLDEPLSALDAQVRAHLRHEIKHLTRRLRLTTILVTHDQEEALAMADRIVVMNHGVIEQVGTPLEIYCTPATPFVADFVGKMNSIPGTLADDGGVRVGARSFHVDPVGLDAVNGWAAGTGVVVCARPEDVIVTRANDAAARNSLDATVDALDFLGAFFRATLAAVDGGIPPILADLSVQVVRGLALAEGERVCVRLPAERLRVFPSVTAAD
ncbi:MAG: putative 2-aminoethylphosphonate ABC transporter ATP-binding protein [Deltaproteobacteria bacterium]|nr:putative 2-aminoethylphosphonate ABC transporter ATP-binding protein [Deltaproteobacteria bacterium]